MISNFMNIIEKLKNSNLKGRSGSGFPTGLKWELVKNEKADKKYIICNASEGEPGNSKDGFILKKYPEILIEGIKIALATIDHSVAYIYLRKDYYQKFKKPLEKLIGKLPITLFKKQGGYLSGEETTILNVIEGKRAEPRIKPPFPTQSGLFGCPTLVNNVETFYQVAKILKGEYKNTKFYSISGDVKHPGVYELSESWDIGQILKETRNWPNFDFFVQAGGGASGEILLSSELNQPIKGIAAIIVYNLKETNPSHLMKTWAEFFLKENCDKCVPCREGVFRISEMLKAGKIDKALLDDLFFVLRETSLCPLGKSVVTPFESLLRKVYKI